MREGKQTPNNDSGFDLFRLANSKEQRELFTVMYEIYLLNHTV